MHVPDLYFGFSNVQAKQDEISWLRVNFIKFI